MTRRKDAPPVRTREQVRTDAKQKAVDSVYGQTFGTLTVVGKVLIDGKIECECTCPKPNVFKTPAHLRTGMVKSCGCATGSLKKQTNVERFGVDNFSKTEEGRKAISDRKAEWWAETKEAGAGTTLQMGQRTERLKKLQSTEYEGWVIIGSDFIDNGKKILCRCKGCDTEVAVSCKNLMDGKTSGCTNCYHESRKPDINFGDVYNYWTVIGNNYIKGPEASIDCRCDCGTIKQVVVSSLRNDRSKSCGKCKLAEIRRETYGEAGQPATHKKYTPEFIQAALVENNITMTGGDINNPRTMALFTWPCGATRETRIERVMADGCAKPKIPAATAQFLGKIEELGLVFEQIEGTTHELTYKGFSWQQAFYRCVDSLCRKRISFIDLGLEMQAMYDSGVTLNKVCKHFDVPEARYYRGVREGKSILEIAAYTPESKQPFDIEGAIYNKTLKPTSKRPDVRIEEYKLLIEMDGLEWHTEERKNNPNHHKERFDLFRYLGYNTLAFTEKEVDQKRPIVDSIINYNIGKSKYYVSADKCSVLLDVPGVDVFMEDNHLFGAHNTNRNVALVLDGDILAAIQFTAHPGMKIITRYTEKIDCNIDGALKRLTESIEGPIKYPKDRRIDCLRDVASLGFYLDGVTVTEHHTDSYNHWLPGDTKSFRQANNAVKSYFDYGAENWIRK